MYTDETAQRSATFGARLRRTAAAAAVGLLALLQPVPGLAQAKMPLIAVLLNGTAASTRQVLNAFREGLQELGLNEGENYRLEVRWSNGQAQRLPALARELVSLKPSVTVCNQVLTARALHAESKEIPIVMMGGSGALNAGLIKSLARPGYNVTGLTNQGDELTTKLLQMVREIAPQAKRIVTLTSGRGVIEQEVRAEARSVAEAQGLTLIEATAESASQLAPLAERCARERCDAMVCLPDPNLGNFRAAVTALAASLRIPAVYSASVFTSDGGLLSYSSDYAHLSRRAAAYVDKILKGANPGDLAIERPTKFELVVNMKAARVLGLKIPQSILIRADRIIE